MTVRSTWAIVEIDRKNKIAVIEDICHLTGQTSITNDAENVLTYFQEHHSGDWRVVYKATDGEWWEIVEKVVEMWEDDFRVEFKPWHGVVWDQLSRTQE